MCFDMILYLFQSGLREVRYVGREETYTHGLCVGEIDCLISYNSSFKYDIRLR